MIVNDLHIMNIAILPLKNDAPLIVNSYAMKTYIVSM